MIFINVRLNHPLLRETFQEVPEMEFEWVRNTPSNGDWEMIFWARGDDFERFDSALGDDPTVQLVRSHETGKKRLYHVRIVQGGAESDLYPIIIEIGGVVMAATVKHDGWHCRFGFPDNEGVDRFFRIAEDYEIDYDVQGIYERRDAECESSQDLTDLQRETLATALAAGYYDVPRNGTLQDLSDSLGVSDSAVSQRLRRASKTIFKNFLDLESEQANNL